MSVLEDAAERLADRKAAAFGVRDVEELEGCRGSDDVTRLVCSGFDIDVGELNDYAQRVSLWFAQNVPADTLDSGRGFLRALWLEGFVLGLQVGR